MSWNKWFRRLVHVNLAPKVFKDILFHINEISKRPVWVEVFIPIFVFSGFYFGLGGEKLRFQLPPRMKTRPDCDAFRSRPIAWSALGSCPLLSGFHHPHPRSILARGGENAHTTVHYSDGRLRLSFVHTQSLGYECVPPSVLRSEVRDTCTYTVDLCGPMIFLYQWIYPRASNVQVPRYNVEIVQSWSTLYVNLINLVLLS
eukprot:SAG11_NODE_2908_length_2845_cov_16.976693_2_plen_201_part_00